MANNKIPSLGFHHIAIQVKDFEREIEFYKALGLRPYAKWTGGPNNEKDIMLLELGCNGMVEIFSLGTEDPSENNRFIHFAMHVDDVDAAYQVALDAGATPLKPPVVVPLATSEPVKLTLNCAFVVAPGGYELEFIRVLESKEA